MESESVFVGIWAGAETNLPRLSASASGFLGKHSQQTINTACILYIGLILNPNMVLSPIFQLSTSKLTIYIHPFDQEILENFKTT